jgi:hypothetical protein
LLQFFGVVNFAPFGCYTLSKGGLTERAGLRIESPKIGIGSVKRRFYAF